MREINKKTSERKGGKKREKHVLDDNTYKVTEAHRRDPYFLRLSPNASLECGVTFASTETHFPHRRSSKLSRCMKQKRDGQLSFPHAPCFQCGGGTGRFALPQPEFIKIHETSFCALVHRGISTGVHGKKKKKKI